MEYGGTIPDSALSASSERDQWFGVTRGRLNTPSDVIIIDGKHLYLLLFRLVDAKGFEPGVTGSMLYQVIFHDTCTSLM